MADLFIISIEFQTKMSSIRFKEFQLAKVQSRLKKAYVMQYEFCNSQLFRYATLHHSLQDQKQSKINHHGQHKQNSSYAYVCIRIYNKSNQKAKELITPILQ